MKTLIIYFSRADENYAVGYIDKGNTEIVAEFVQELTGADMFKVEPAVPYAADYRTCIEEAKKRIGNAPIKEKLSDISAHTRVRGLEVWFPMLRKCAKGQKLTARGLQSRAVLRSHRKRLLRSGCKKERCVMSIIVNLRYTGKNGSAIAFAEEMTKSGTVDAIRNEDGNLRYEYYISLDDPETVLLIDEWTDQAAIDRHHASPMMQKIAELRDKYDLHMTVERYVSDKGGLPNHDKKFVRE